MPQGEEKLEDLGGGIRAIVSGNHTFGADAVLLADFSHPPESGRLCDLGTGCGIIPLLWRRAGAENEIDAFELDPDAADMARRAMVLNGLTVAVHMRDFRRIGPEYHGRFRLVTCNPPYTPAGAGTMSASGASRMARHETACTLADVTAAASRLLLPGGRLCLCMRPDRLSDVLVLMHNAGLEPKRLRLVQQDMGRRPWLVLAEGRKGGRSGLLVEPVLLVRDGGGFSAEMRRIYGCRSDGGSFLPSEGTDEFLDGGREL